MAFSRSDIRYELKKHVEVFGQVSLELETIADLDAAIDSLCDGVDEKAQERIFVEELCPYFGVVWPAARALTEHLGRMGSWLNGKTVLEVGCGLALPSLACAKLGAKVTATDFHPDVPVFLENNMKLNSISPSDLKYVRLDWREDSSLPTYDFVIGSDILYESDHPKNVAKALAKHCHPRSHIIITDPGRPYLQSCVKALEDIGFRSDLFVTKVRDLHADRAGDKATKEVFIISLQNR